MPPVAIVGDVNRSNRTAGVGDIGEQAFCICVPIGGGLVTPVRAGEQNAVSIVAVEIHALPLDPSRDAGLPPLRLKSVLNVYFSVF